MTNEPNKKAISDAWMAFSQENDDDSITIIDLEGFASQDTEEAP